MHRSLLFGARLLPCLLLIAAGQARGQEAMSGTAAQQMAQVMHCHALMHDAPGDALALAEEMLAVPTLPPAVEIGAVGCRGFSLQLLGRGDGSLAAAARLQVLMETPGLPAAERNRALQMASTLLQRNGQTEEGLQLLERALEYALAERDVGSQIGALSGIALIHGEQLDDPEGALQYQQRAITLSDHLRRSPLPQDVMLHYNHGYTLLRLGRHDEAGKAFDRAEAIARRLSSQDLMLHRIRGHRAEVRRANGQLEAARAEFLAILPWQQQNDPLGEVVTLQRLARIALDQQQPEQARDLAEHALAVAEPGKFPEATRDSLDLLAETSVALGDTARARDYLRQARQLDHARLKGDSLGLLARLQAKAEQALDPVSTNATQEASRDRLLRNVALAAVAVLLLGGIVLYLHTRRQQRRLRRLGTTDALTGLLNQREAERLLVDTATAASSDGRRSAVLLLEIDGFKSLNERHGHATGNRLLRAVADAVAKGSDQHDHVARWSGAAFMVIRGNTSQAAAFALAAHLHRRVERLQVEATQGSYLTPTVSIGVAPHPLFPGTAPQLADTLQAAGLALQVAHRSGHGSWAGLWGRADGDEANVHDVLHDPEWALAQGWIAIGGGRPMSWAPPRDPAAPPARARAGSEHA